MVRTIPYKRPVLDALDLEPFKVLYDYDPLINKTKADHLSDLRNTTGSGCPNSDQLVILQEFMKQQLLLYTVVEFGLAHTLCMVS